MQEPKRSQGNPVGSESTPLDDGSGPASAEHGRAGPHSRFRSPLYHQIYLILRQRILDGDFGTDGRVPGEQDLTRLYGVSRITAKRALNELAAAGLVVRERGRGTRVAPDPQSVRVLTSNSGGIDPLIAMGGETDAKVLEFGYVPADSDTAASLGLAAGAMVQRVVRVRSAGGEPFSHLIAFVPEDIGRHFGPQDLETTPLLMLLERAGVVPSGAEQTVSATLADAVIAGRLGVEVGAPLLRVRRVVVDRTDRPIELLIALYRPDRYRMTMTLSRDREREAAAGWASETVAGSPAAAGATWRARAGIGE